ncbi:hypothetical protein ACVXHA_06440 [Escherichia coli]
MRWISIVLSAKKSSTSTNQALIRIGFIGGEDEPAKRIFVRSPLRKMAD